MASCCEQAHIHQLIQNEAVYCVWCCTHDVWRLSEFLQSQVDILIWHMVDRPHIMYVFDFRNIKRQGVLQLTLVKLL